MRKLFAQWANLHTVSIKRPQAHNMMPFGASYLPKINCINARHVDHDNFTRSRASSAPTAGRELRNGRTQCQCSLAERFRDRPGRRRADRNCAGLSPLPRQPPSIATISRLRHRSPGFAGAPERSPGADEPPVSPHGCRDLLALAARQRARALGKPVDSLGLHLSAAIHRPRSGALRHTAVDLGKTGRRHRECASRAASAGEPVRQRTGGVAAHLRARCAK
jgi:hypothetical protein